MSDTPQLENGYTKIANEILDALIKYRIPGEQVQVLLYILRKTYGFNKTNDRISNSQFVSATGMKKGNVSRAVKNLVSKNIVIKSDNKYIPTYRFNKNYKTWKVLSILQPVINITTSVIKSDNKLLSKVMDTKENKDNITKDNIPSFNFEKKVPIPTNIFLTPQMLEYARKKGCNGDHVHSLFEGFTNYYGKSGKKWKNWTLVWYDWVRNDKEKYHPDKYITYESAEK